MTQPEHGEPIVSEPFKRQAIGNSTKDRTIPKWGDDLEVLCNSGHLIKIPHQDVLDGLPVTDCPVCKGQLSEKEKRKREAKQRQIDKYKQRMQDKWIEEHNEQERARRERRKKRD